MATLHSDVASTKNSNTLENKQLVEDSHTDPPRHPYVGSVPIESDCRC